MTWEGDDRSLLGSEKADALFTGVLIGVITCLLLAVVIAEAFRPRPSQLQGGGH